MKNLYNVLLSLICALKNIRIMFILCNMKNQPTLILTLSQDEKPMINFLTVMKDENP
jgi:hypothetical protein